MAIHFNCTKCSHLLQVPDEHARRKAKCPNCGHILPVPGQSKTTGGPPAKPLLPKPPATKPLAVEPLPGPKTPGPIPSLSTTKKKGKKPAKSDQAKQGPPELRSGKKAVILGVALVAVLVGAVVVWKMGVFSGKEPEKPTTQKRDPTKKRQQVVAPKPKITPEQLKAATEQMEEQLAALQKRLEFESASSQLDESLIEHLRALQKYKSQMPSRLLSITDLGVQVDENKAWLYEHILARAQSLVGQYRFSTAKELLDKVFSVESDAGTPARNTANKTTRSNGRRTALRSTGRSSAEQACRSLADGELIKRGLTGQVCLWVRKQANELGEKTTVISLDPPDNRRSSSSRRTASADDWQQIWGPVSTHLAFIRRLQVQAEDAKDVAQAGLLYSLARQLKAKCILFETPGPDDAELLKQLTRRRADRKGHEQVQQLIAQCRYKQALLLAKRLLDENPTNLDNHLWLLRCYLESYNALSLSIDLADLRRMAHRAANLAKYDLPNNLLSVGLGSDDQPAALAISQYRQWGRQRGARLDNLAQYAAEYAPIVDWLRGESRVAVLRDFQYRPFLAGEPIDLLDSQGVIYTVYSRAGPPGKAAVILARIPHGRDERGLYLHMVGGQRYRLWNIYPPDSAAVSARGPSKPSTQPVMTPELIRATDLSGQRTIPLLTSLGVLRCEQDGDNWTLLVPRMAIRQEQQLRQEKQRTSVTPRRLDSAVSRLRDLGGIAPRTTRSRVTRNKGQDGYVRVKFPTSGTTGTRGRTEPITCLIREKRVEISYFTDDKGKYLIGPSGKRFYITEGGFLSTLDAANGPDWCLALSGSDCPGRLRKQLDAYSENISTRTDTAYGSGSGPAAKPGDLPLTVFEAASWIGGGMLEQTHSRRPTRSSSRKGTDRTVPIVSRWLVSNGRIIAQVKGQIAEVAASGMIESMFYSPDDAAALLGQANDYYQVSLSAWPTLGGEVYRLINSKRLAELIGQQGQRRSSRNVRLKQLVDFDLDSEFARAGRNLAAGDINQALAIYGDLTGVLSLRLQQAIADDVLSLTATRRRTSSPRARGGSVPTAQLSDPFLRAAGGGGYRRSRSSRSGTAVETLSPDEQYFLDADMLVQTHLHRAVAYQQAQLPAQARQSLGQAVYRVRGQLQPELIEWTRELEAEGARISPELLRIGQQWQALPSLGFAIALQRSLQAAEGQPITVPWPNTPGSVQPTPPVMSLATWLSGKSDRFNRLSAECLFAARQFDWVRASLPSSDSDASEPLDPDGQARQIIELLGTYQVSSPAEPGTANALWQLGSFLSATGYSDEAWQCLGQASAVYSQLAQSLLPPTSRLISQPRQIQEKYYVYRVAGLAALAQAAAIPSSDSVWPDTRSLLLAEIRGKLSQIYRTRSDVSGQDVLTVMLRLADRSIGAVQDLDKAGGLYESPRMRFWWWYYPAVAATDRVAVDSRWAADRPKLEYTQPPPESRRSR
ncbi:MAG: hypothetical protein GWP14_04010, partial [Actinobacteria bacterium]|nr:hypothetical protein [Actinomycetota bacterium]